MVSVHVGGCGDVWVSVQVCRGGDMCGSVHVGGCGDVWVSVQVCRGGDMCGVCSCRWVW